MAYPALPTHPTRGDLINLADVRKGDEFTIDGWHYRAEGDAVVVGEQLRMRVYIQTGRKHAQMNSGWEAETLITPVDTIAHRVEVN